MGQGLELKSQAKTQTSYNNIKIGKMTSSKIGILTTNMFSIVSYQRLAICLQYQHFPQVIRNWSTPPAQSCLFHILSRRALVLGKWWSQPKRSFMHLREFKFLCNRPAMAPLSMIHFLVKVKVLTIYHFVSSFSYCSSVGEQSWRL